MKVVISAAGNGTRLYPLGVTQPKVLIPILNKPLLIWTLDSLQHTKEVDEVILVISAGLLGKRISSFISELVKKNLYTFTISLAIQEQQLGTAHVLEIAKPYLKDQSEFIFLYGDDLYGPANIKKLLSEDVNMMLGKKVTDPEKWGILTMDKKSNLKTIIEKPTDYVGDLANIGCMRLPTQILELFDQLQISKRGEYEITDSLQLLAKQTSIKVFSAPDYWIPIGYPWHLIDATKELLQNLHFQVRRQPSKQIHPTAIIENEVLLGDNVAIGPFTRVIGPTTIGDNVEIGSHCVIDQSIIYANSTIGSHCSISTSIIGGHVKIGSGVVFEDESENNKTVYTAVKNISSDTLHQRFGCVCGDKSKIQSNATLTAGVKIWPGANIPPGTILDHDIMNA